MAVVAVGLERRTQGDGEYQDRNVVPKRGDGRVLSPNTLLHAIEWLIVAVGVPIVHLTLVTVV